MALVLFDQGVSGLSGSTWRYQRSQDFSGKHISFAGAPDKLDRTVEQLVPAWSAWPGFRGVALHGLDPTP